MRKTGKRIFHTTPLSFLLFLISVFSVYGTELTKSEMTLGDCVRLAVENHPELAAYRSKIKQKEKDFYLSKIAALPAADLNASYSRLSYISPQKQRFIGQSYDDYLAGFNLKYPLFTGGRNTAEKRSSEFLLNISKEDYKTKEIETVYKVKTAYYKLFFAKQSLTVQKELLHSMRSFLETATQLNKQRKFPREETLLRIQSQTLESEQGVIAAQKEESIANKILLNAMGFNSDETIKIAETDETAIPSIKKLDIQHNPELLRAALEIERSNELIKKSKSGYFPYIDLAYSYGYEWGDWPPENDSWTAGIFLKYPLWDWRSAKYNTEKAKDYHDEAKSIKELITKRISFDMEAAFLKYESAQARIQLDLSAQEKSKKSLELFELRYSDGSATSIEMLDAQQSYLKARTRYIQSLLELRLANAEIEKIAGGDFNEFK